MTTSSRIRVLVVDDSAFARKVLREALSARSDVEVVGIARDGLEALEKASDLRPDVITLDLMMPNLDGIGVLQALSTWAAPPRVVVVSLSDADSELGITALQLGAVELVRKPTALATDQLYELSGELVRKVLAAAVATIPRPRLAGPARPTPPKAPAAPAEKQLLLVGGSTGGPRAISLLISALPAELPVPVVVVVHLPPGYTAALAQRLDDDSHLTVREAVDDAPLEPGVVLIAPAGVHSKIHRREGQLRIHFDPEPSAALHRPSVDELFKSAAEVLGGAVLGVVLTGMGDDGLLGSRALTEAGSMVLAESRSSCVVYGMPRCVIEAGLAAAEAPIDGMAEAVLSHL